MSDFSRFRDDGDTKVKAKPKEGSPTFKPDDLLLCVDQSLAKSGWILGRGDRVMVTTGVLAKGKDVTLDGLATFTRADDLFLEALALIKEIKPMVVVHERPPVGGGRMVRPESSIMSAVAWRNAAKLCKVPTLMVARQKAAKLLTGNGNAKKAVVQSATRALLAEGAVKYYPPVRITGDIIDAIAVWLTALDGGAV